MQHLTPFKDWLYFPKFALAYFVWSLLVILLLALALDRAVIPRLEAPGIIASEAWKQQTTDATQFMIERNKATLQNPVWHSDAFMIKQECPKEKRLLVLGDSFVWGHAEANLNHTWWRQLEAELTRRGHDVEVMGAGISGGNTSIELDWAKKLLIEYKPDLIVWSYVINDPAEINPETKKLYIPHIYQGPFRPGRPTYSGVPGILHDCFPNLYFQLAVRRGDIFLQKLSNPKTGLTWEVWLEEILHGKNFEEYKKTVKRVGEFTKECKTPNFFFMMVMPVPERYEPRLRPVEALFRENQITYFDRMNEMVAWYQKNFPNTPGNPEYVLGVTPVDNHAGALANHFYAVQTADILERNYRSVLGTKPASSQRAPLGTFRERSQRREAGGACSRGANELKDFNDWVPFGIELKELESSKSSARSFSFTYPADGQDLLTLPLGRRFVQLNFAEARAGITQIQLNGDEMSSCSLALGMEDPFTHTYQVGKDLDLGEKSGSRVIFSIPENKLQICELKITAKFSGNNRQLTFHLIAPE